MAEPGSQTKDAKISDTSPHMKNAISWHYKFVIYRATKFVDCHGNRTSRVLGDMRICIERYKTYTKACIRSSRRSTELLIKPVALTIYIQGYRLPDSSPAPPPRWTPKSLPQVALTLMTTTKRSLGAGLRGSLRLRGSRLLVSRAAKYGVLRFRLGHAG